MGVFKIFKVSFIFFILFYSVIVYADESEIEATNQTGNITKVSLLLFPPVGVSISQQFKKQYAAEIGGGGFGIGAGSYSFFYAKTGASIYINDTSTPSSSGWRSSLFAMGGYAYIRGFDTNDGYESYQKAGNILFTFDLDFTQIGQSGGFSFGLSLGGMYYIHGETYNDTYGSYETYRLRPFAMASIGYSFR